MPADQHCFAPCPRGLEQVLADELCNLGSEVDSVKPGGVAFRTSIEGVLRTNLWSRFASRILLRLLQRPYRSEQDIYKHARGVDNESFGVCVCGRDARSGVRCRQALESNWLLAFGSH